MTDLLSEIERRHADACAKGELLYSDPQTGWSVMTGHYLRQRGFCCGLGCRHCPYVGTASEHPDRSANRAARNAKGKP